MKKYVFAVIALGLLAACSGKKEQKSEEPVVVEEAVIIAEVPTAKPVNMRDSLVMEEGKGTVIEKQYSGVIPGADVPGIEYDLTLYFQQDSENGVYALRTTYQEAENGEDAVFWSYGKRKVVHGIPGDSNAIVYRLIPDSGDEQYNFLLNKEEDLTLLQNDLKRIDSQHNYTLKSVL